MQLEPIEMEDRYDPILYYPLHNALVDAVMLIGLIYRIENLMQDAVGAYIDDNDYAVEDDLWDILGGRTGKGVIWE